MDMVLLVEPKAEEVFGFQVISKLDNFTYGLHPQQLQMQHKNNVIPITSGHALFILFCHSLHDKCTLENVVSHGYWCFFFLLLLEFIFDHLSCLIHFGRESFSLFIGTDSGNFKEPPCWWKWEENIMDCAHKANPHVLKKPCKLTRRLVKLSPHVVWTVLHMPGPRHLSSGSVGG